MTPSGSTANVAEAFTPPTRATATADSAAARRGDPEVEPRISGSSTQGASALGQASMEIGPRTVSMRGESAKARPAAMLARSERTPRARTTRTMPRNATHRTRACHSRWTIQPGTASGVEEREERAHRPQVAVGLVLQLTEGAPVVPQVQRTLQELLGRHRQVELGVRDQEAGVLDERQPDEEQTDGEQTRTAVRNLTSCATRSRGSTSPPLAPAGPAAATATTRGCSAVSGRPRRRRSASGPSADRPRP